MPIIVKIVDAQGIPHAGRYVESWNPNTVYGHLDLVSTDDPAKARRFSRAIDALADWGAISTVQKTRPDGRPNKPLTALSVTFEEVA